MSAFLAIDWGTTNLRGWRVNADGDVEARIQLPCGVSKLAKGEAQSLFEDELIPRLAADDAPALLCGMIGSTIGWRVAPYAPCPAGAADIARLLVKLDARRGPAMLVPGLRCDGFAGASDVMRGEETQALGWIALDEPYRGAGRHILCLPGTHSKWVLIEDGRIHHFITAMTGELFDILRKHSVLAGDGADDAAAFAEGLDAAGRGDALSARLFSARARVVADDKDAATTASYLSGLLIGAEIAALPGLLGVSAGQTAHVIGDDALAARYAAALARRGWAAQVHSGETCVISGLRLLAREAGLI
jgi:2-dehydro-3-deoxygalactonokinase